MKESLWYSRCLNVLMAEDSQTKEASMLEMLMELLILGFVLGIILVVAFVVKWFIHFAE